MSTSICISRQSRVFSRICSNLVETHYHKTVDRVLHQQKRYLKEYQEKTARLMYWRGRSFDRVHFEKRRCDRQDWNYRSEIFAFSRRLQENLDENTLRQIFAHPSYIDSFRENQTKYNLPQIALESNAGLVQRGCSILDDCIKSYLRYTFTKMPEEGILAIWNYLKSVEVLADVAKWIGCKELILSTEYPPSPEVMSDTFKAVVAGVDKDLGLDRARRFIVDIVMTYINDKDILEDIWLIPNPKETLNLLLQNSGLPAYEPRIIFHTGVKTLESCYIVGLYVDKKYLGSSAGETLKIAEETAALDSLQRLFDLKESRSPYVYGDACENIDFDSYSKEHERMKSYRFSL